MDFQLINSISMARVGLRGRASEGEGGEGGERGEGGEGGEGGEVEGERQGGL